MTQDFPDAPPPVSADALRYTDLLNGIKRDRSIRDRFVEALEVLTTPGASPDDIAAAIQAAFPGAIDKVFQPGDANAYSEIRSQITFYDAEVNRQVQEAFTIAPQLAGQDLYFIPIADRPDVPAQGVPVRIGGSIFTVAPDTAARLAQANFQFSNLSASAAAQLGQDMYRFNNLSARDIEEIALQLRTSDRLDDDLSFRIEDARAAGLRDERRINLQAQGIQAQFAGLELTRRGQMADALAQDFAFQIEIGRMRYQEAELNLARMDRAITQRREEREVLLQFAVRESSLRTVGGELVTRLPGAQQLANLLSQSTGQTFNVEDFDLPVGRIDPQAAGEDVLRASAFESPIPGLLSGLQSTRDAMSALLSAPVAVPMVSDAATAVVAEDS